MSRIITELKCGKCGKEFQTYISFGHPEKDFDFKWNCDDCHNENTELIEALPYSKDKFYDFFEDCKTCHYNSPYYCGIETKGKEAYCADAKGKSIPFDEYRNKSSIAIKKFMETETQTMEAYDKWVEENSCSESCPVCGNEEIVPEDKFCKICGKKLEE